MAELHDVFICHASEDKDAIARPLAERLTESNVDVWFDEFSLELGDSLRRKIDQGLRSCRYGVVILSPAFFGRAWSEYELDGLIQKDLSTAEKTILPIWHNVGAADVREYSLALADRVAIRSNRGLNVVVQAILRVVRPIHSPLVIARDLLLEWGHSAPVVTDQFWLEAVEASNRIMPFGADVPDESAWGRWAFPLPSKGELPIQWGERIAWSAMQKSWVEDADSLPITPLSRPKEVHSFIHRHPGLFETCAVFPDLLVEYAPQLSISGFEGDLEQAIEAGYKTALAKKDVGGEWSLRHSLFHQVKPVTVAYEYFHGGMFGPTTSPFGNFDHLVWVFSADSKWLPANVKAALQQGMLEHPIWIQDIHKRLPESVPGESLCFNAVYDGATSDQAMKSRMLHQELRSAINNSAQELGSVDPPAMILARMLEGDVIGISHQHYARR